jgi:hypothetical protein
VNTMTHWFIAALPTQVEVPSSSTTTSTGGPLQPVTTRQCLALFLAYFSLKYGSGGRTYACLRPLWVSSSAGICF